MKLQVASLLFLTSFALAVPCHGQEKVLVQIDRIEPEQVKAEGFRLDSNQRVSVDVIGFRTGRRYKYDFTRAWILNSGTRKVVWEANEATHTDRGRRLVEYKDELSLPKGAYEVYYSSFPSYHSYNHKDGWGDFIGNILDSIFDRQNYEEVYDEYRDEWREFKIVVHGKGERVPEGDLAKLQETFKKDAFISMTALGDDAYEQQGFELQKPMDLRIYAIGEARTDGTFDYGWIMNTKDREKVWALTYRHSDYAGGSKKNRVVDEIVSLPAGKYAAFFVTDDSHSYEGWNESPPYDPMFWGMTVMVTDASMRRYIKLFDYQDHQPENVVVSFTRVRDDEFRSRCFTLNKPMDLRLYALGEGRDGGMYDYGWIVNAKTHEKVWEMKYSMTEHAGGGEKNRLFDGIVHFDKGNYIVYYVTDGSHSYRDWNTTPPYDQESWGITILGADDNFDPKDVGSCEEEEEQNVLAKIVRVRDRASERQDFTMKKDGEVRIYAIGEGTDGRMYDYGWIENAQTGQIVWEMTYRRTDHAGGARKNRMFNGTIFLRAGKYTVFYESDDSHSFNDWNSEPPYDPVHWGITVYLQDQ